MDWKEILDAIKNTGQDTATKALDAIPGASSLADVIKNSPQIWNEIKDSSPVQSITKGLAGEPLTPNVPNAGNPISNISQGLIAPAVEDALTPSSIPTPASNPPALPDTSAPTAPESAQAPSGPSKATPIPSTPQNPPVANPTSLDNDSRQAMLDAEKRKHNLGIIPETLGGIADAIGNAATAEGGKGSSGTQAAIQQNIEGSIDKDKAAFEEKLKNDPSSQISQQYQHVLALMYGKDKADPNISNLSANQISQTLPEVEKFMQKELQLQAMKSNKDISLGLRTDQQQDKLENQYRQQLTSVRGDPNISGLEKQRDASAQAYNLLNDSKQPNGTYNLSEPQMVELYGQLYTAMTGRGLTGEALKSMDQATAKGKMASIATFIGLSPSATTQAIGDRLMHMTTTLGTQTQGNIDKRMENRLAPPSGLAPERAKPIRDAGRGYTFQELVQKSNERKASNAPTATTPTTKSIGGKNYVNKNGQWFEVQ